MLDFFATIGVYDVILPFLLVFTILYAVLEKTKVFGMEKIGKEEYSRKNLNAMVSFAIAFLVIASSKLVAIITTISSQMVVLLIIAIFFLMLVGSFYKEDKEGVFLEGGWKIVFMVIMFIGLILIALNALTVEDGRTYLAVVLNQLLNNFSSNAVGSIVLIIVLIGFMYYITKTPSGKSKKEEA